MRYPASVVFALLTACCTLSGQVAVSDTIQSGNLFLNIKSINFVKNNEYYSPVIEGYTLLGTAFRPVLVYQPSDKVTINAGAFLLKYSGTDKFTQVRPVLSTSLKLSESTLLTIGSLSGSDKHKLSDPHFNSENIYSSYAEDGFQLYTENEHFFNDAWLSWEKFIFQGDTEREVFTFGESFRYTSDKFKRGISYEIPLQIQFKHYGGQISNYDEHVETYLNFSSGLRINIEPAREKFGVAAVEYLHFINKEFSGESANGISNGSASWIKFHYRYRALSLGASYWRAKNFFAPDGNAVYSSVSHYRPYTLVPERKIITNYINIKLLPESYLELFLGLETYYDIDFKRLDNSIVLHLNFDKLIKLATLKP